MLVLTRKGNQSIMIGDEIEVSVLAIMGEKVRIGIQAPRDVPVFRKEVYLEIQEELMILDADTAKRSTWRSRRSRSPVPLTRAKRSTRPCATSAATTPSRTR